MLLKSILSICFIVTPLVCTFPLYRPVFCFFAAGCLDRLEEMGVVIEGVTSGTGWLAVAVLMLVCLTRAYSIESTKSAKGRWDGSGKIDDDCWSGRGRAGIWC